MEIAGIASFVVFFVTLAGTVACWIYASVTRKRRRAYTRR